MSVLEIRSLVDAFPAPALLVSASERVLVANAPAERIIGRGLEGRHYITILRQPALLDSVEATLRRGVRETAVYMATEAPRDTTYRVTSAPVALEGGQGALLTFEDITALQEAGQIRRDFVANVSHELRTPLTALIGFIETLKGAAKDDASARTRFLDIMEREATRMTRLVHDLLSLSRVEAEERVRPTDPVEIGRTIQSVLSSLKPLSDANAVKVDVAGLDTDVTIPGDPDQIAQVFTNLVENALKYGRKGGSLRIALTDSPHDAALRGPAVIVSVSDDGEGIPQVHIPRLTERFYRVDSHRSRELGGTGLGLAIVKHIVNRHRGRLKITSVVGQGSTFTVILPKT